MSASKTTAPAPCQQDSASLDFNRAAQFGGFDQVTAAREIGGQPNPHDLQCKSFGNRPLPEELETISAVL
jgi:hypothetical protein